MGEKKITIKSKMELFIEKMQSICADLYEEYNQLDDELENNCPLTEMIDVLYAFSIMPFEDIIDEDKSL